MQQFLKTARRAAWAWIVAAELLLELVVPVDDLAPALDVRLGGEAPAALARSLKSARARRSLLARAWSTSTGRTRPSLAESSGSCREKPWSTPANPHFGGAARGRSPSRRDPRRRRRHRPRPPRPAPRARGGPRSPVSRHRTHGRSHAQPRSTARARPPGREAATAGRTSRCRTESRRRPAARAPVRAAPRSPGPARGRTGSRAG